MKKLISLLLLFSFWSYADAKSLQLKNEPTCVGGSIDTIQYDSNNYLWVTIQGYDLYTDRTDLQPIIFSAFSQGKNVEIDTTSCYEGGEFSKIQFYKN